MVSRITQEMRYRESVIKFTQRWGVSKASRKFNRHRSYIYFWKKRYDGTIDSLAEKSKRPKFHPQEHTPVEVKLITDMRRKNSQLGLIEFWLKLVKRGYQRTVAGLYKIMKRLGIAIKIKLPLKYTPKPYEQMLFPGERVQIDVKRVPRICLINPPEGLKLYQYTAIDEFSRVRYVEGFAEQTTYSSTTFLQHAIAYFKKYHHFHIKCVQTDNGTEFTNRLLSPKDYVPTLFDLECQKLNIHHKLIKPYTPRHNGKVERSHREDQKRFYNHHTFFNFSDFKCQLKLHLWKSNNMPMRPLGYKSPVAFLRHHSV